MTAVDRATARRVLDLPLDHNGADAPTVRAYLIALLSELWRQEAGFSGKRPFGDSGWQYDVYIPMVRAGLTPGTLGFMDDLGGDFDYRHADSLIQAAIAELGRTSEES